MEDARKIEDATTETPTGQAPAEEAPAGTALAEAAPADQDAPAAPADDSPATQDDKIALPFKIFGVLNILMGIATVPFLVVVVLAMAGYIAENGKDAMGVSVTALVVSGICIVLMIVLGVLFILLGVRLLRNKKRLVSQLAYIMLGIFIARVFCSILTEGIDIDFVWDIIVFVYLIVLATYIDPALKDERALQRKLGKMELRQDVADGTLGRDKTGKGYLKLDFFNMFWICILACVVGIIFETFYVGFTAGVWQNRTGMLWGPFSPIYGIGALLMTVALNRFYKQNVFITFIVSAFIGAAFEYFVSWFLQASFGIVAWDYSNAFLNLNGRTDLFHFLAWGFLGAVFVRWLMPLLLKIINLIPWKWRYGVTAVFAAFMLVNATFTLVSFDRWFERLSGVEASTAVEVFVDDHFPNDWMENHFQSMDINPENAKRMDSTAGMLSGPAGTT